MTDNSPYYRHRRTEMAPFIPTRYAKVLEIGCAEGTFRDHLTAPCEYWGIEPAATAATVAGGRLHRVLTGTYQDVASQLPEHYFDLVICNDVIEHMPDHDAFFAAIPRHMAPDGCLVGSIPNVRYLRNLRDLLVHKDWHYRDSGILDRTHLRFFTRKSLRRTLAAHGYQIELLRGIGPLRLFSASPWAWGRLLMVALLGGDTRYRQFAFRVRTPLRLEPPPRMA